MEITEEKEENRRGRNSPWRTQIHSNSRRDIDNKREYDAFEGFILLYFLWQLDLYACSSSASMSASNNG